MPSGWAWLQSYNPSLLVGGWRMADGPMWVVTLTCRNLSYISWSRVEFVVAELCEQAAPFIV